MKNHAFLIQAHAYPELLEMIISRLTAENHYFFLHIDKRNKYINDFSHLRSSHVFLLDKRIKINWGGFSQIEATISLMKHAQICGVEFAYYHLISGQDYPIIINRDFDAFFDHNNKSYFELVEGINYSNRYMYYHITDLLNIRSWVGSRLDYALVCIEKLIRWFVQLRKPIQLKAYKGGNWWSMEKELFNYVMNYLDNTPSYIKRFRHSYCCDEIFFHTIVFNSPLKNRIIHNNLRYVDWHKKDASDHLPRILDESDYDAIQSSKCIFARKVSLEKSMKLIEKLGN